jgi:hypothetical protein
MAGYSYARRNGPSDPRPSNFGHIGRVPSVSFCEVTHCIRLASWRIGYDTQCVDLCPRHTLATMRNRRLWLGRPSLRR